MRTGDAGLHTIRDWVLRFNARGPEGLVNGKAPGAKSKLDDEHRLVLFVRIEAGPIPAVDGVVRWRLIDVVQWIFEECQISVTKQIFTPRPPNQNLQAHSHRPIEMIFQGWSMSLSQAKQQWSMMSS